MDDTKLIQRIQAGQREDFGELYDKYIEKIYAFVFFKTHHRETAEDLVSLVFLKAVKKINDFDPESGTFQAWLYMIARNTVIDHYRTKKQEDNIDDVWDISSSEDIENKTDIKHKLEKVEKYLQKLDSSQRDILIMRLWQGLSHKEIAEILGKSEASCKMMFSRSLKRLREEMPAEAFLALLLMGLHIVR